MSKYVIDNTTLTAIGDAIRTKEESTDAIPVTEIADRILALGKPGEDEGIVLTGNLQGVFSTQCWNEHMSHFKTENVTTAYSLFNENTALENIPFEINFSTNVEYTPMSYIVYECNNLRQLPKVNNGKPGELYHLFTGCYWLTTEDITNFLDSLDYSYMEDNSLGHIEYLFYDCYSLRTAPLDVLYHDYSTSASPSIYYATFSGCYSLDEILDLRVKHESTLTSNRFYRTFNNCVRLKNMTFATQEDGTPYTVNWKSQTIQLNSYIGYIASEYWTDNILNYNSGITADKEVKDDATYQALKDDPDWYTLKVAYSRYNHDSAVATINSLPDASAYLAANGGTNTIQFTGNSGSATDGGAINTLTEEEIAVAAAKGWTVTLL